MTAVAESCTPLRSFELYGFSTSPVAGLMPSLGYILKAMNLLPPDDPIVTWRGILNALHNHCRELKSIIIHNPFNNAHFTKQEYVHCLMHYGYQLESAYALMLGKEECAALCQACTNLSSMATDCYFRDEQVSALEPCLHRLYFGIKACERVLTWFNAAQ